MVNSPPTPASLNKSSDSMTSIEYESRILNEGVSPSPSHKSLDRPSPGSKRGSSAHSRPSKFGFRSRDTSREYDFTVDLTATRIHNLQGGVMSLVKGCLGGGILCVHESYKECGLWTALAATATLGMFLTYSIYELTRAARMMHSRIAAETLSYAELAEAALENGPWKVTRCCCRAFRHLVELFICINCFGGCAVYQTMMARQIKQIIDSTEGLTNEPPTVRTYIAILLLPCIVVSVFASLKQLAPFSIVLDFFFGLMVVTTMCYGAILSTTSPLDMPAFDSMGGLFELVGVSMFAMDGTVMILAVENSLRNPKIFPVVLVLGMSIVVSAVMLMGSFGFLGFGEKSMAPITVNIPWGAFSVQLKAFVVVVAFLMFALNFWVPSGIVWSYASSHHNMDRHWLWERIYRTLLVIMTNILSLLVPSITVLMGLLGSSIAVTLGFICPAFIVLHVDWMEYGAGKYCWRIWKALILMLMGLVIASFGTYYNCVELILYLTDKHSHGGINPYESQRLVKPQNLVE